MQSLNPDQARVYEQVKSHLEHHLKHEKKECHCTDLQPLHMFVSGVGGTGKSFLIKTVWALVSKLWGDETRSTLCAVTAPTGLAAFNVGGVTIHRLLQLPIEHEGRGAGWLLEAGQRDTQDHAYVSVQAQTAYHRRSVYGVQSELGIHSPASRRDLCPRRVVWRGECSVCGKHSATHTSQWSSRV